MSRCMLAWAAAAAALFACDDGAADDRDGAADPDAADLAVDLAAPDAAAPDADPDAAPDAAPDASPEALLAAARLDGPTPLEGAPQSVGDAMAGWDYLRYGAYLGSGIPFEVFRGFIPEIESNPLDREGPAATVPYPFNVFETHLGVEVASGVTCFGCHAGFLDGRFVPGLGDALGDFTLDTARYRVTENLVVARYGADSPEAGITRMFTRGVFATGEVPAPPFAGVNPAFALEYGASAHRVPETLEWRDDPAWDPANAPLASDVPPLWHVKKKHALYYNGMGRGDFGRLIQQIVVVTLPDATHGAEFAARADDVLAWILSLEPPVWPGPLDEALAAQGRAIFEGTCSRCHGTYGDDETYPNLLVPVEEVGTDPVYAERFVVHPEMSDWFGRSWFAEGAWLEPRMGYVAPPLDGIWATAPYLHNASVPTLTALLDSSLRPRYFRRDFDSSAYDFEAVGWPHEALAAPAPGDRAVYDTTVEGYGNRGHVFGDALSADQRRALLEYLKTL